MNGKDDIQKIKDELQTTGAMLVKNDIWPPDSPRLLVIGSRSPNMNADALADDLYEYLKIVATPLPKKSGLSNLYSFIIYTPTGTAPLYDEVVGAVVDIPITGDLIEGCFGGTEYLVNHQVAFAALGIVESPVTPGEMADLIATQNLPAPWEWFANDAGGTPIPLEDDAILAPNTWVFLRADFTGMAPMPPKGLKLLVEQANWDYKVVNPIGGISGFFERVFSADDYVGPTYSHVFFNPGFATGVTAASLQAEVFGSLVGGNVYLSAFTTPDLIEDQGTLDIFYSIQGTEEGVGEATEGLLAALQKLLKALPVILWGAIALGVVWAGWKGYKYIKAELGGG